MINRKLEKFISDQLSVWPMAADNYRNLKKAEFKTLEINGLQVLVQHNPCRKVSSEAALDKDSIARRPCFLCPQNRPKEQFDMDFEGRKGKKYRITLNPYPIFPNHLVVSSAQHTEQSINHRFQDMLDFAGENPDFICFYNGPHCGASAPDHMHFQACPSGAVPLQRLSDRLLDDPEQPGITYLSGVREAGIYSLNLYVRGIFLLKARTPKSLAKAFYRVMDCAETAEGESEPRMNLMAWKSGEEWRSAVIFRKQHRSHHYWSEGEDHLAMSPGCADMAGVFVTPRREDFAKLDESLLMDMLEEITVSAEEQERITNRLTRTQKNLEVGILTADEIEFEIISDGAGRQKVEYSDGKILYNGALYDELVFEGKTLSTMFAEPSFILYDVVIGINFHWERKVDQQFAGTLKFIVDSGKVTAVDVVGVEDYLLSVISSEMKSSASLEFLKAHAVISRSWVMAQIAHRRDGVQQNAISETSADGKEYIKWFDHDDHTLFDVCADDHCQRYQGLSMAVGETVRKAIDQTWGLVLTSEGKICDARFSKCCGGTMELFSTCWEDVDPPYIKALPDTPDFAPDGEVFCDTDDESILSQVLNDYDLETKDFYRWTNEYSASTLDELVNRRSEMDFGEILALVPVERGPSGRLFKMEIVGSKKSLVIGKELIIRRFLSESHLKSSAFSVIYLDSDGNPVPDSLVVPAARRGERIWSRLALHGSGWGHGVGLCQIGAAVMSSKGYGFKDILSHYYPGSELTVISK